MKRIISMALALLMLLALVPAAADNGVPVEIYRIVKRTDAGDVTLGSGVLYSSSKTLLTVKSCWGEGDLYAIGADGEHAIVREVEFVQSPLIFLEMATESAYMPLSTTNADQLMSNSLYGVSPGGEIISMQATLSRVTVIEGRVEVLLNAAEGLMPGAIMLGADGGIACMTVWQHGEGEGVYAAVTDIVNSILSGYGSEPETGTEGLLHGFTATVTDGQIHLDWSDAADFVATENTVFTVYTTATCNPYLTFEELSASETGTAIPAIPGTDMLVWIAVSEGSLTEHVYPQAAADAIQMSIPAGTAFADYGFRNLRSGVTPGEEGMDGWTEDFLPQQPLTRQALSDRDTPIYFQSEDMYEVSEVDSDHALLIALYTPEGYVFSYQSGYIFMPEIQSSDLWVTDVSVLFEEYEQFVPEGERWPAGEYEVICFIDGGEASRVPFTLD